MGQKVSPIGLRIGINKTWESRWYAKKDYQKNLHEDITIRNYMKKHNNTAPKFSEIYGAEAFIKRTCCIRFLNSLFSHWMFLFFRMSV